MASSSPPAVQSWHEPTSLWLVPKLKKPFRGKRFRSTEKVSNEVTRVIKTHQKWRRPDRNTRLAQTLDRCNRAQQRLHWRPVNVFCKINSFLKRKRTVCRTSEMAHAPSLIFASLTFGNLPNIRIYGQFYPYLSRSFSWGPALCARRAEKCSPEEQEEDWQHFLNWHQWRSFRPQFIYIVILLIPAVPLTQDTALFCVPELHSE